MWYKSVCVYTYGSLHLKIALIQKEIQRFRFFHFPVYFRKHPSSDEQNLRRGTCFWKRTLVWSPTLCTLCTLCTLAGWSTTLCTPFLWSIVLIHRVDATLPSTPNFILYSSNWNAAHCMYHLHQPLYFWRITFLLAPVLINRFWGCSAFLVCAMTTHAIVPKSDCFVDQTFQNLPEHLHLCWNFQHFLKACLGMPVLARSKSVLKVNTFPWRGMKAQRVHYFDRRPGRPKFLRYKAALGLVSIFRTMSLPWSASEFRLGSLPLPLRFQVRLPSGKAPESKCPWAMLPSLNQFYWLWSWCRAAHNRLPCWHLSEPLSCFGRPIF